MHHDQNIITTPPPTFGRQLRLDQSPAVLTQWRRHRHRTAFGATGRRPLLLDLFCGVGGAAMGYYLAGYDVVGVDHEPQPHYPFAFHQADALAFLTEHGQEFDAIHASPPCQAYSVLNRINRGTYPDLIAATRRALIASGRPYVIENVPQAPLHDPVLLCGATFGLRLYRHRAFESSVPLTAPPHDRHVVRCAPLGHVPAADQYMSITGGHRSRAWQRTAGTVMGVPWAATAHEVSQAIPPAYTRFIGEQLREELSPATTEAA